MASHTWWQVGSLEIIQGIVQAYSKPYRKIIILQGLHQAATMNAL
jgi:hypothetical protein